MTSILDLVVTGTNIFTGQCVLAITSGSIGSSTDTGINA